MCIFSVIFWSILETVGGVAAALSNVVLDSTWDVPFPVEQVPQWHQNTLFRIDLRGSLATHVCFGVALVVCGVGSCP